MNLQRPAWFADLGAWWVPVLGEEVAARVRPLGFDAQHRLHVECDSRAWVTQVRQLADRLAKRLDTCLPQQDVTGLIVHLYKATPIPPALEEHWQELVGEDLGAQVFPLQLVRQGQELSTLAFSVEARDRFRPLIPQVLNKIRRLLGPDCVLTEVADPSLYSVTVAVTASDGWTNRDIVESVLLDTWYDVTQVFGPEHSLRFEHTAYSPTDHFVEEWVARHAEHPDGVGLSPMRPPSDEETLRTREAKLLTRKPDLCLAFLSDPGTPTRVLESAWAASIPVRITTAKRSRGRQWR